MREQGHEARLLPGQFVKPYRKANKKDYLDAEAIAEAITRNNKRFVPIKTADQLDLHARRHSRKDILARHPREAAGDKQHVVA
jgi:transposase